MANEVIITYYKPASASDDLSSGVLGEKIGGEVVDIGTRSAAIGGRVALVQAKGSGFWLNMGGSTVNAAPNTDGNLFLADGDFVTFEVSPGQNYIDTAADA